MIKGETTTRLPDGRFEQKVQVDRRKLEIMITDQPAGHNLPEAEEFFSNVMSQTHAQVFWPAQLKIGAKTKKDP
ncbi:unnamed protein product [Caenorhabditis bovis]|uniref:BICC1 first type I KH domain-containing protein n=1 Tax=Caenorhabditis bovis TaxID=2654633 RepID=A0A8S1F205_9PELO|nr:unnamed protein product [Caenorhabditis bovis]